MTGLKADWVVEEASFSALAPEWNRLARQTDPSCVFLLHEWHRAAWQWLRETCDISVLRICTAGRTVGMLPLVRQRSAPGWGTVRLLRSFEIPDSQQTSLLCLAEDADAVAAAAVAELQRVRGSRDLLSLRKMSDSAANRALKKRLRQKSRVILGTADNCPCVRLEESWENYYQRRSRRLKKGNNLIANRLKRAFGAVSVERVVLDASERGQRLMRELVELSAASWKADMGTAIHASSPRAWFEELRTTLGSSGAVVAWCLRLDGRLAAAEVQLDYGGIVSALRADVMQELESHGPGTYLGWKVLEGLMGSGRRLYNMGPGTSEYKSRWSEGEQALNSIDWYSPTAVGYLHWLKSVRTWPRRSQFATGTI